MTARERHRSSTSPRDGDPRPAAATTCRSLDFVSELQTLHPEVAVVVLTGYGSIATALERSGWARAYYLTKPADVDEIIGAFERGGAATSCVTPDARPPSLARVEWEHINRVLTDCDGNISEAARGLGLHRRSLQRKLAKYPSAR